ncbi:hypothetical protein JCM10212_003535 [Sporobolomyces blumeae]
MQALATTAARVGRLARPLACAITAARPIAAERAVQSTSRLPDVPSTRLSTSRSYSSDQDTRPRSKKPRNLVPVAALSTVVLASSLFFWTREDPPVLAPDRWTPVKVQHVERLTPETSLFRLEVPKTLLPPALDSDPTARPILSLFVKDPTLQIQRAYTPLTSSSFNPNGPTTLDLVVKRYPDGEVSRYLHRLGPGDEVSIRAPSVTWYYRPQDWDEVVFVAGGTGVTPAYQLINDTLRSSSSGSPSPKLSLVYASPSPLRILLRSQLDAFENEPGANLNIKYLVDRAEAAPTSGKADDTTVGFITRDVLEQTIGRRDPAVRRAVVVCGPEGMVQAVAGPRGRNFSQGPVGGMLRELGYTDKDVVKL